MRVTDGNFGTRARNLRERAGLTREQLGRNAKVSTSTVARLELSDKLPGTANMMRIAAALGVGVNDIIGTGKER